MERSVHPPVSLEGKRHERHETLSQSRDQAVQDGLIIKCRHYMIWKDGVQVSGMTCLRECREQ
jgi:hypothetical protein